MSYYEADFISLAGAASDQHSAFELTCPFIGWDNIVNAGNVSAGSSDPDFPITNVANPATHLKWKGVNTSDTFISINVDYAEYIDYIAIAGHNFRFGTTIIVYTDGLGALLHFDGVDASTTITSSAYYAQAWTAHGNAQIDTGQSKFGGTSLQCDGTGDYVDTPDNGAAFDFTQEAFTVDMWVRPNASGALNIAGQVDAAGISNANSTWQFKKNASNFLEFSFVVGTSVTALTSTTTLSTGTWYHIAAVRTAVDGFIKLFLNGVQQAQAAVTSATILNNSNQPMTVGRAGSVTGTEWNGWIDEFHIWIGGAIWLNNFTPPTSPWVSETQSEIVPSFDPSPILIRFPVPTILDQIEIDLSTMSHIPEIAVIYAGRLLIMERSIKLEPDHVPINLGRKTRMVNGMSESGNFLGRIVLSQYSETKASFSYITQTWYRDNMDDFVLAARETPFFWVWNPSENPTDVGYSWLTADPQPAIDPVTRRISVELQMRAVTE